MVEVQERQQAVTKINSLFLNSLPNVTEDGILLKPLNNGEDDQESFSIANIF
ncbi:hypothetical protein DLJ48_08595 [Oenococcus sicerae]|uniref:Uncharacterized protein n=1 Tax=Oenococcus sicerae TaxID=2203724 RepID=A0ABX6J526_9LACO|nr:hypothetical protein [Oenococcus sicerae]QHW12498.1 hypothetical protein DLJ48_08595 [Oenococcus sicerae]